VTLATGSSETAAREAMASLVGSLADNKAALGRRYAEWAVSAPTLESAVAAAAMAQDELGHARSTYPVLKALGIEVEDAPFGGERRLAPLDHELPGWTSFVAANLVIDGVLATFVASCVDSSVVPMAQRARKILQEEGAHRVHAEVWAKRLCRQGDATAASLLRWIAEAWEHAGRWAGPDDDPGTKAALDLGMIDASPARQRETVRAWLADVLGAAGIECRLPEPEHWGGWDAHTRRWTP
jgi:1,2-phenylacetyl-CoA epoxidase catalytic subunit